VFFGKDYISVGKNDNIEWGILKPLVYEKIENFYATEQPLFTEDSQPIDTMANENDSEAVTLIKEILETKIRPNVQEDGGDIEFLEFDEVKGIVYLVMKGACTDCPSSRN
jgi:NFU1 iron-sulfur cluster scaffold homolog, mitochondrial